jgi:hypothetical protein
LKSHIEEYKKFREMLANFIDHKNRKALLEDINKNKEKHSLKEFESRIKEMLQANSLIDQQK